MCCIDEENLRMEKRAMAHSIVSTFILVIFVLILLSIISNTFVLNKQRNLSTVLRSTKGFKDTCV